MTKPSSEDLALIGSLTRELNQRRRRHDELDKAYRGERQVEMIGLAAPERLRGFEFPLNWCRVTVDSVENRQDVRSLIRPGAEVDDKTLREAWIANDMEAQASLLHRDTLIQGHGFVSVSTNPDDADHPLITVESSRSMIARIDPQKRQMTAALRLYADPHREHAATNATLYLPERTLWLERSNSSAWDVVDVDEHELGRVPVCMALNRRQPGRWVGQSEMADVIGPMDMSTRAMMNAQLMMEIAAMPRRWVANASKEDFIDPATGQPRDSWSMAMDAVWAATGRSGGQEPKFGQFDAADPGGLVQIIRTLAEQCSSITGLPVRYFGQNTVNPATEGAISADESRLIKNVERKNRELGTFWGWVLALYERFRTGEWLERGDRISVEWHDPATPTIAQRTDALVKARQVDLLSRQGAWDEMGWSEARKGRELEYMERERRDPQLDDIADRLIGESA